MDNIFHFILKLRMVLIFGRKSGGKCCELLQITVDNCRCSTSFRVNFVVVASLFFTVNWESMSIRSKKWFVWLKLMPLRIGVSQICLHNTRYTIRHGMSLFTIIHNRSQSDLSLTVGNYTIQMCEPLKSINAWLAHWLLI